MLLYRQCISQTASVHKPILFLGYNAEETSLIATLQRDGRTVVHTSEKIAWSNEFDLVISFGYRHIISQEQIDSSIAPIINLESARIGGLRTISVLFF